MAKLPQASNTGENSEKMKDFTPIPAGDYLAAVKKSVWTKTKAGDGHYIDLTWVILDGEYKGRLINFDLLNLDNPNPDAVAMANKQSNSISDACGLVGVEDSEEWHGIPIMINVVVTPATLKYPSKNEIKKYYAADAGSVSESEPVTESKPKPEGGVKNKPAWLK